MTDKNPQEGNNPEPLVGAEFDSAIQHLQKSIEKAQAAQASATAALIGSSCTLTNNTFGYSGANTGIPTWGGSLTGGSHPLTGTGTFAASSGIHEPTCGGTHVADDDATWIVGDTIHTTCKLCGETLLLQEIPGGVSMLKVRALLGGALMLQEGCDEAILGEVLGIYAELLANMEREEEALDEQRRMLELAGRMLQKKVAEGA